MYNLLSTMHISGYQTRYLFHRSVDSSFFVHSSHQLLFTIQCSTPQELSLININVCNLPSSEKEAVQLLQERRVLLNVQICPNNHLGKLYFGNVKEIDNGLFSKRISQAERSIPEQWIFGGICPLQVIFNKSTLQKAGTLANGNQK